MLAAHATGRDVAGACGREPGESPAPLAEIAIARTDIGSLRQSSLAPLASAVRTGEESRLMREIRGLYQLVRLARLTRALVRVARPLGPAGIVHANDFDTLPAGFLLARAWGARLVYDAHELYLHVDPRPPFLHRETVRLVQRLLGRAADAVVTVSDPIAEELERTLRLRRRPLVVLNCPELVAIPEVARPQGGPLRVIYQATVGTDRFPEDVLDAVAEVTGVEATLRIAGADAESLRRAAASRGIEDRVVVADPVDPGEIVRVLAGFDVGLVIDRPLRLNGTWALPNKLFEYFAAGLAVVVPALPTMSRLVEEREVGLTFKPGSPQSLAQALRTLAADRSMLDRLQARASAAARDDLNAERQQAKTVALWEELSPLEGAM